ncbi:MAG: NifB/NifX family molybdenum-iron cluster-binding protein [Spirochaetales bacterium]|nr:NifB/NifX family molybdenum-iron cluster-binding protein [Spirochaetales bacterium]
MKLAFCLTRDAIDAPLDQRFGRAEFYGIVDSETGAFEAFENSAKHASGGAGSKAVQQLVDKGVEAVIAPEVGPQALDALNAFSITAFRQGGCTTVQKALDAFKAGTLEKVEKPGNKGLHRA